VYAYDPPNGGAPQPAINLSITHGVVSSFTMQQTGDMAQAIAKRNPALTPDIAFADVDGHGYAMVRADPASLAVEFVCVPRPIERSARPDGGELAYRVTHQTKLWRRGEAPRVERIAASLAIPLGSVSSRD
jgi:alkaline phosphatase D